MSEINWDAVERLLKPLHNGDPLHDWAAARRLSRQAEYLADGGEPSDAGRTRLLCWFFGLRPLAADPAERRLWTRPLRDAGVSLPTQTWLWIALERFLEAPLSEDERIAHDAVALERVGAVGVARAFARGGRDGSPLHEITDYLNREISEAVFLTPAGRRLGVRRIVYTRRFLKELEEEE